MLKNSILALERLSFLVLFSSLTACATASAKDSKVACWQQESYQDKASYNQEVQNWYYSMPIVPDIFTLLRAYNVSKKYRSEALRLGNDKTAHCFMGCKISEEVNFKSAVYAAWRKEYDDLKDCNSNSHFEIADFNATIDGAENPNQCQIYCQKYLNKN